jgi:hypothetical protein
MEIIALGPPLYIMQANKGLHGFRILVTDHITTPINGSKARLMVTGSSEALYYLDLYWSST